MTGFQNPRGTRDFLPDEMVVRNQVERQVRTTFESYGYQQIQTPTFELYDLFAARSGEEIRESMFTFASDAGRYALRPELTAPVCRVVANGELNRFPRPYKLYYFGPCFRYCRPQQGRYREFVQTGVELIGTRDPLADAEMIRLAVRTVQALGIANYSVRVGEVGVYRSLLQDNGAAVQRERQSQILSDLDRVIHLGEKCHALAQKPLSPEDRTFLEGVHGTLLRLQTDIGYTGPDALPSESAPSDDRLRTWLELLPRAAETMLPHSWVFHRVLPEQASSLLMKVAKLRGSPEVVLREARALLPGSPALSALDDLEQVCQWLNELGMPQTEVVLGMARNLDFYSGMVFEIDAPVHGAARQVCGGGRYDRLVEDFGGSPTPATGFAFGFDRLVEAYRSSPTPRGASTNGTSVDALVVSPPEIRAQAVQLTEQLRDAGLRVGLDLRGRSSLEEQIQYFWSLGAPVLVTLSGASGPIQLQKRLPDTETFQETRVVSAATLAEEIVRAVRP